MLNHLPRQLQPALAGHEFIAHDSVFRYRYFRLAGGHCDPPGSGGPGIDQAVAGSLFKPYQTSREDGMGLGLSISHSIIETHNGKLWADEQRKKGALFCMSIPVID